MPATTTQNVVHALTETAAHLVGQIIPDGEGACLGASALLAYVLHAHGVPTTAVRGEYDEHAHWWLETDTLRIDPTRGQFDFRPLVEELLDVAARNEDPYLPNGTFPARWTRDQAVVEFARMFVDREVGAAHGRRILTELEQSASTVTYPKAG